jgi:leucyl-tRNA synthetase
MAAGSVLRSFVCLLIVPTETAAGLPATTEHRIVKADTQQKDSEMTKKIKSPVRPYNFRAVEQTWRPVWSAMDLYRTGEDPARPSTYILDFFPYPSGDGLSVGHCRNYIPTCVSARFHRMRGYNVLHPMGWDAFGLPAENYAIAHGIHPQETTRRFAANYRRQMQLIECSYDWSREINSTDPAYYRWTQWFFLLLFERGLAYRAMGSQWWCPHCRTILANEQVEQGRCWRCDSLVERKDLEQWYFRITDYADRLLADLATIHWPEPIKQMQRTWIGRSEGVEITFRVQGSATGTATAITVFTTRPDTLFGATFVVLAPEHELLPHITTFDRADEVESYTATARRKSEIDRQSSQAIKSGVFTGAYAIHPLSGKAIPIWVADYVLTGYGTGAIMGVPAHDERDFAFASRYRLPVIEVVSPDGQPRGTASPYEEEGIVIDSGPYDGLPSPEAGRRIAKDLNTRGLGQTRTTYRLRDWLISRQRYWGAPIPMIHCPACGIVPVPESDLPVILPDIEDFVPSGDGRSPLSRLAEWVNTTCPQCAGPAQRETDTMDGFACSSWYFLRYASPHEDNHPFDPAAVKAWLPVTTYVGGAEHAVMHLLYARFWTKVMADAGLIDFVEPFSELRNQGVLMSAVDGRRMSKSRGNVVTPDEVVDRYGTDVLRLYVLFLGPFDADVTWDERGIVGVQRFLERFWKLAHEIKQRPEESHPVDRSFEQRRHQIVRRVTGDMEKFRINTAIAAMMEYLNELVGIRDRDISADQWHEALQTLTLLLAPFAPFITEELWQNVLGEAGSVHEATWPVYDDATASEDQVTVVIQVNGRLRDRMQVTAGTSVEVLRRLALENEKVQGSIAGQAIHDAIVVPDRLVNIVSGKT